MSDDDRRGRAEPDPSQAPINAAETNFDRAVAALQAATSKALQDPSQANSEAEQAARDALKAHPLYSGSYDQFSDGTVGVFTDHWAWYTVDLATGQMTLVDTASVNSGQHGSVITS